MKSTAWIVSVIVSILIGAISGVTPVAQSFLSLNLWFVIPVGGIFLGVLIGFVQSQIFYHLNCQVKLKGFLLLGLIASMSYLLSDFAVYRTLEIEVKNGEKVQIHKAVSFEKYMAFRLEKTSYTNAKNRAGSGAKWEIGSTATKVYYSLHLLGSFLGAALTLAIVLSAKHYCSKCERYLKPIYKGVVTFLNSEDFGKKYEEIALLAENDDGNSLILKFKESVSVSKKEAKVSLNLEARKCSNCGASSIYIVAMANQSGEWKEIDELEISKVLTQPLNKIAA